MNTQKLTGSPRILKELAQAYGVSKKTLKSWLACDSLKHVLGDKIGNYFTIAQVQAIVDHLGEPG